MSWRTVSLRPPTRIEPRSSLRCGCPVRRPAACRSTEPAGRAAIPGLPPIDSEEERQRVLRALEQSGGNRTRGQVLGVCAERLINRVERLNLAATAERPEPSLLCASSRLRVSG